MREQWSSLDLLRQAARRSGLDASTWDHENVMIRRFQTYIPPKVKQVRPEFNPKDLSKENISAFFKELEKEEPNFEALGEVLSKRFVLSLGSTSSSKMDAPCLRFQKVGRLVRLPIKSCRTTGGEQPNEIGRACFLFSLV